MHPLEQALFSPQRERDGHPTCGMSDTTIAINHPQLSRRSVTFHQYCNDQPDVKWVVIKMEALLEVSRAGIEPG